MTFTLKIKLGNEAMQTPFDVADALARLSVWIYRNLNDLGSESGNIRDLNGNRVGEWKVTSR